MEMENGIGIWALVSKAKNTYKT